MTTTTRLTLIHEAGNGDKIEFRVSDRTGGGVIHLEHRGLQKNGQPHDDRWYPVSDWLRLRMQETGSDIIQILDDSAR